MLPSTTIERNFIVFPVCGKFCYCSHINQDKWYKKEEKKEESGKEEEVEFRCLIVRKERNLKERQKIVEIFLSF